MGASTERNYVLDLLRIIAIYFVVLTHCATKSQFAFFDGFSFNRLADQLCMVGDLQMAFSLCYPVISNTIPYRFETHRKENRQDYCKVICIQHGFTIHISMTEYKTAPDL